MANLFTRLFGKTKPTRAQLSESQKNILREITANIHIIQRLAPTRERVKAMEKLRKLRATIRHQNAEIKSTQRMENERRFSNPVHDAAMQTSWKMGRAQAQRQKELAAMDARAIIQKQVHMHALRGRKRMQKATRRA